MVNPLEFLKIGGFAPQVSIAAKEALVWQTHDMMFLGGLAWNWSGRLVKSLSNDAFNELNGRKKIEVGGAPLDEQLLRTAVKDGLFQLAKPYLEASSRHYQSAIEHSNKQQDYLITKSMELKEKELEATFTLLGKLPKQTIDMILSGMGHGDYQRKIDNTEPEEDRGLQDEEKYPDRYKPKPEPTPEPKPEPKPESMVRLSFKYGTWVPYQRVATSKGFQYKFRIGSYKQVAYTGKMSQHQQQIKAQERQLSTNMARYRLKSLPVMAHEGRRAIIARLKTDLERLKQYRLAYKNHYGEWT